MEDKRETAIQPYMTMSWKIAKLYTICFAEAQRKYSLTANERDVLLFLHNNRGFDTAADIVKYRSISKSLVSKSVDSLTRRGFLETVQTERDLRQVHLCITKEATSVVLELTQTQRHFFEMLGEGISEAESDIFNQVLRKLENNAERYSSKG